MLRGDPTTWLLETENPSVCYWTLTDILDRPVDLSLIHISEPTRPY